MKKASVLSGIGVLALTLLSFAGKGECEKSKEHHEAKNAFMELQQPFINNFITDRENDIVSVNDFLFVEIEEEIDLGFDTATYLPEGFDAYAGMGLNLNEIDLVETEEEIDLGFDTAKYLPLGFNAYEGMDLNLNDIVIIESEEEINLGFDTAKYLPAGFNPYNGMETGNFLTFDEEIDFHLDSSSK